MVGVGGDLSVNDPEFSPDAPSCPGLPQPKPRVSRPVPPFILVVSRKDSWHMVEVVFKLILTQANYSSLFKKSCMFKSFVLTSQLFYI